MHALGVSGVVVEVFWGVVEARAPHEYDWSTYQHLVQLLQDEGFVVQVRACMCACACACVSMRGRVWRPTWGRGGCQGQGRARNADACGGGRCRFLSLPGAASALLVRQWAVGCSPPLSVAGPHGVTSCCRVGAFLKMAGCVCSPPTPASVCIGDAVLQQQRHGTATRLGDGARQQGEAPDWLCVCMRRGRGWRGGKGAWAGSALHQCCLHQGVQCCCDLVHWRAPRSARQGRPGEGDFGRCHLPAIAI
jgi:hypothetical protein